MKEKVPVQSGVGKEKGRQRRQFMGSEHSAGSNHPWCLAQIARARRAFGVTSKISLRKPDKLKSATVARVTFLQT